MAAVEVSIPSKTRELARMPEIIDRFAAEHRLSSNVVFSMNVALDEILGNIIRYGYTDDAIHDIHVRLSVDGPMVGTEIEDDGRPFDPCVAPAPEADAPVEARRIGGLGIHIVRNLMSQMEYARVAGRNRLVMKMSLDDTAHKGGTRSD